MLALVDIVTIIVLIAFCYIVYKRFFTMGDINTPQTNTEYEQGFTDAVEYFGLRKLYEEDQDLKNQMQQVFGEAGIHHRMSEMLDKKNRSET